MSQENTGEERISLTSEYRELRGLLSLAVLKPPPRSELPSSQQNHTGDGDHEGKRGQKDSDARAPYPLTAKPKQFLFGTFNSS